MSVQTTMKNNPMTRPMPLRFLGASTRILLNPEFVKDPDRFAPQHGVNLAGEASPLTSFKKNPDTMERIETVKTNIHLVRHGAIRLFTEGTWIRSIDLCPSILLYGNEDHPLTGDDLTVALSMLRDEVSPLLADPLDACHIVPGLVNDDQHVAHWKMIESKVLVPGVDVACLHQISHPLTGPDRGATENRLKLEDRDRVILILIESAKWTDGGREVHGVSLTLTLKGNALLQSFGQHGTTGLVGETMRLVGFPAPAVAQIQQETMARLEGFHLPVPPEWSSMGKPLTAAKAIALLSEITSIPLSELKAIHANNSRSSESTRKRLDKDVASAAEHLRSVAVRSLFHPGAYAVRATGKPRPVGVRIDPLVAAAYGPKT